MIDNKTKFSKNDFSQFENLGISLDKINDLLEHFVNGFQFMQLDRPATVGDGIVAMGRKNGQQMIDLYDHHTHHLDIVKFVPASGAASRMFKDLFEYVTDPSEDRISHKALMNIDKLAFSNDLKEVLKQKAGSSNLSKLSEKAHFILEEEGLNYGYLPKGLIKFHNYEDGARTAFEEHLVEGAMYSSGKNQTVNLHFTISPEFKSKIKEVIALVKDRFQEKYGVQYNITYSEQMRKTDTLAVDMKNEPFRDKEGKILFRPGGHGALIENLNEINADMIFIKNIDNIVPDRLKPSTVSNKKILAGELIHIQDVVATILNKMDDGIVLSDIPEIALLEHELITSLVQKSETELRKFLMRPIRICGMVKNQGEPGGGPFWVKNTNGGDTSLQIVESVQVDPENKDQLEILKNSSHFNPVDIVCWVKDYKGQKFDLTKYVDQGAGFISYKSKNGKELKAQELPGLWNGAMSDWITLFVEVDLVTFNPVKTLNDLLRENHQA